MPRVGRIYQRALCYHVMNRGVNRQEIFVDNIDREYFVGLVSDYKRLCGAKVYHWVLMGNHYHMLVEVVHGEAPGSALEIAIDRMSWMLPLTTISRADPGTRWGIGSESFLSGIRGRYESLRVKPEDKTLRRHLRRRPVEKVLNILEKEGLGFEQLARRRRDSTTRAMGIYLLIRHAGLSQREVAQRCGMQSGSSVSHLVRQLRKKLETNRTLSRRFDVLETAVNRYFKG